MMRLASTRLLGVQGEADMNTPGSATVARPSRTQNSSGSKMFANSTGVKMGEQQTAGEAAAEFSFAEEPPAEHQHGLGGEDGSPGDGDELEPRDSRSPQHQMVAMAARSVNTQTTPMATKERLGNGVGGDSSS